MFRFMQRFGRDSQARGRGTGPLTRVRRRNHRLNCEALESRQLLSGYYIINEYSGKVLDDPGASTSNGAVIDQWQLNGGTNQRWDLIPVGERQLLLYPKRGQRPGARQQPLHQQRDRHRSVSANGGTESAMEVRPAANGGFGIVSAYSQGARQLPLDQQRDRHRSVAAIFRVKPGVGAGGGG